MKDVTFSKQRKKLFLLYLSAFACIFLLLAFIMIQLIRSSSYVQVDNSIEQMAENPNLMKMELEQTKHGDVPFNFKNESLDLPMKPNNNSFNTQVILWSKTGTILNSDIIGNRLSELESLELNTKELDDLTTITLDSDSSDEHLIFRSLILKAETNDSDVAYIQIISNVNQVQASVKQSQLIIVICMVIFWLISIIVSFYLSKMNMKPILKAWDRQQEFVANASHELRTPLTIISLNLEKLFTKPNHTILQESEAIAEALNETKRLSKLTTDLLLLAKSDSHSLTIEKQPVNTTEFIDQIVKPFQFMAEEEEKSFIVEHSDNLIVSMDQEKIHQVLLILIDNALKYTQAGNQIKLTSTQNKKNWVVTLENNGSKIEPENLERIFQRFYQDPLSSAEKADGFGLGLAIAKQILDEHEGKISVKNLEPSGVSFQFSLPITNKAS